MKKLIKGLLALTTATTMSFSFLPVAQAEMEEPLFQCGLEFTATGTDIQIIIGRSRLDGVGNIHCIDVAGNTEVLPIKVTIKTPFIFPRLSLAPHMTVRGVASGIGLNWGGPEALLGDYLAIDARAALGIGAGASLALHGRSNAVTINLALQGVNGIGFAAGATMVKLEPLNE